MDLKRTSRRKEGGGSEWNLRRPDGTLVSETWFDWCGETDKWGMITVGVKTLGIGWLINRIRTSDGETASNIWWAEATRNPHGERSTREWVFEKGWSFLMDDKFEKYFVVDASTGRSRYPFSFYQVARGARAGEAVADVIRKMNNTMKMNWVDEESGDIVVPDRWFDGTIHNTHTSVGIGYTKVPGGGRSYTFVDLDTGDVIIDGVSDMGESNNILTDIPVPVIKDGRAGLVDYDGRRVSHDPALGHTWVSIPDRHRFSTVKTEGGEIEDIEVKS